MFLVGRYEYFNIPFSAVCVCVCVQGEGSDADEEVHSEELVMPGSLRELAEFEQHATSLARCSVSCTLPSVHIHLPNKSFLETLYNRWVGGFNWSMGWH